jgi:microcystin-dependent protein
MSEVTSVTLARVQAVENAEIASGSVDSAGHLKLTKAGGGNIDCGIVVAPTGSVVMSAAALVPAGWLLCNGQEVSRTTYADLWAALGTLYGAGNGTTTFNVPNLEAKFPRMEAAARGGTGGATAHAHSIAGHDHTIEGGTLAARAHVDLAGTANPNFWIDRAAGSSSWASVVLGQVSNAASGAQTRTDGAKVTGQTAATGSGATGNPTTTDLPPYVNLNFIIKT